ncbi:MAG: glutaredoxin family protein [Dethiobacter sp.]|nr:glutaredoxin family protein [Dethiobacter sp.]
MKAFLYALSTCFHCQRTKKWLDEHQVDYEYVDVDLAAVEEKKKLVQEVKEMTGSTQFPVIIAGDQHLVGFNEERFKKLLGLA